MKPIQVAFAAIGLALLTWVQFPGHTWLQQDSQIYIPVLENLRDPQILRNDILVQQPYVSYTLYDEISVMLSRATGLSFRVILAFQQIASRAFGIWGLFLVAQALGLGIGPAWTVAMIVSLGARIAGPEVLTFEYEPTPRAFAVPLLFCAIGLAANGRHMVAGIAAAVAFLYHAPTTVPFWIVFAAILVVRRNYRALAPLAVAAAILAMMSWGQGSGPAGVFKQLTASQEQLQRLRAAYVWISMWPRGRVLHYLAAALAIAIVWARLRHRMSFELRMFFGGLVLIGLLSMPLSWLLLEQSKLSIVPKLQPMRALLFVTLTMQILTAAAAWYAAKSQRWPEAGGFFLLAYLPSLQISSLRHFIVVLALAVGTLAARNFAPAVALIAFFALPTLGGITNYPRLHTPELKQLAEWAHSETTPDSVFLFPDIGRGLQPGIFRSVAGRAVYVDWKGGGQVNYLDDFGDQWWFRWQQTMAPGFQTEQLLKYRALGIHYIVVQPRSRLPRPPQFENAGYVVYRLP